MGSCPGSHAGSSRPVESRSDLSRAVGNATGGSGCGHGRDGGASRPRHDCLGTGGQARRQYPVPRVPIRTEGQDAGAAWPRTRRRRGRSDGSGGVCTPADHAGCHPPETPDTVEVALNRDSDPATLRRPAVPRVTPARPAHQPCPPSNSRTQGQTETSRGYECGSESRRRSRVPI